MIVFFCHPWNCQVVIAEDRLGFCASFAVSGFDWHCQVRKVVETMCSINHNIVLSHDVQPMIGHISLFMMTKCSVNVSSPMSSLSVAAAMGFSN